MLYLFILLPIISACFLLFLPSKISKVITALLYSLMLGFACYLFVMTRFFGEEFTVTTGGEGILGITLYCDLTASIFLVLICFLFICFYLYSAIRDKALERFNFFITILQSLIILIILSRDLFNIFVAVEVATMVCSILIMFKKESRSIYDGLVYLLTNTVGMLFFLMGVALLYRQFGVLDISVITQLMSESSAKEILLPYAFIMTGVMLKCAVIPLHMWLPYAHGTPGAPTVVSAILSGLYVKSGIYLFIRMRMMFIPAISMDTFFLIIGIITAIFGIVYAISQKDIKLILAYHTISQIGLILIGLSLNDPFSYAGAMLHIINHALFKSLLFLSAGILISKYKTRNVNYIRGVFKTYPLIGLSIIAGILGITGAPLFNGSISKYFIQSGANALAVELIFIFINFGTILSFIKFGQVLIGEKQEHKTKNDAFSNTTLMILGGLCMLTGIFGSAFLYLLSGNKYPIDIIGYISKVIIWIASFSLGWAVYKGIVAKIKLKGQILFSISFNTIAASIVLFFTSIIIIGFIFY